MFICVNLCLVTCIELLREGSYNHQRLYRLKDIEKGLKFAFCEIEGKTKWLIEILYDIKKVVIKSDLLGLIVSQESEESL